MFASICLGNPVNGLDPDFTEEEIVHMIGITKPVAIFCELDLVEPAQQALKTLRSSATVFTFGGAAEGALQVSDLFAGTGQEQFFQ